MGFNFNFLKKTAHDVGHAASTVARGDNKAGGGVFGFLDNAVKNEAKLKQNIQQKTGGRNPAFGEKVFHFIGNTTQELAKIPETAVRSTAEIEARTANKLGAHLPTDYSANISDPIRKKLYGTNDLQTYQQRGQGIHQAHPNIPAPIAGVALAGLDLTPGGGGKKNIVEQLAKADTVQAVKKLIPGVEDAKAQSIASQKDPHIIENIVKGENKVPHPTPVPPPPKPASSEGASAAGKGIPTLPEKESGFSKAIISNSGIISRQGEHGQQLANDLGRVRDIKETTAASITRSLPIVTKLKPKEFEEFVNATEGKIESSNPLVQDAVKEWQSVAPKIRNAAVKAGVDVGDLGPNYFPHKHDYEKIFGDQDTYARTVNHMLDTGQAKTIEDAQKQLRFAGDNQKVNSFGNLEQSRKIDLPDYEKTKDALLSYVEGASRRIGESSVFGAKNEKAYELLAKIGAGGHDAETAQKAFEQSIGLTKYNDTGKKVSGALRQFQSTTKLGLGALTNASQSVNTAIKTGYGKTLSGMAKNFTKEGKEFADKTGVISDAIIRDLKEQTGFTGKVLSKITAPGFGRVEKFNRRVAALAGRDFADGLARKGNITKLKELGVTGEIGRVLTEAQQVQAARKIVEKTQFKTDAQDLPYWANTPQGKIVSQFRTFSYKQSGFVNNEILKPLAQGNALPLIRLLAAIPVGYGIAQARDKIQNKKDVNHDNVAREILNAWQKVGGGGLLADIPAGFIPREGKSLPSAITQSRIVGTALGPTAGTAYEFTQAVPQAVQGNPKSLARLGTRSVPVAGPTIANTAFPYTSLTDKQTKYIAKLKKSGADPKQIKADETFFQFLKTGASGKSKVADGIDKALRANDKTKAQKLADDYNKKLADTLQPWIKQYGSKSSHSYANKDLLDAYHTRRIGPNYVYTHLKNISKE